MMEDVGGLTHLFVCVFLFNFSLVMVTPAITDVTMAALCPGQDECSLAIYLTGFQQVVTGLGALILTPLIGNLSDKYGRKALLTLPMALSIIPLVILAYDRSRPFFYAYYGVRTITGMCCEGSMQCLSFAYVADKVAKGQRVSAFGILAGISTAGLVTGNLIAGFLSISYIFEVSAAVALLAAVYMRFLLAETAGGDLHDDECSQHLCPHPTSNPESTSPNLASIKKTPSFSDMICLLKSSLTLLRAAFVTFLVAFGEGGIQASLLYFLKAKFHFSKDQFADFMLISSLAGAFSQLFLMPILSPFIGEEKLLILGLLANSVNILFYSIAWASWVPYLAAMLVLIDAFVQPCICSTVSKKIGHSEQGMALGCITGISSFASIISPFAFTPLTSLFLSESAPFDFKGFSIMCCGFPSIIAFMLSIFMKETPILSKRSPDNTV